MARPSFLQWRASSSQIPGTSYTVPGQTVKDRQLAALAAFALRTNPDGTTF